MIQATPSSNKKKNKKKKNKGGTKKKMTHDQVLAFKFVSEWVFLDHPSASSSFSSSPSAASCVVDDFGVQKPVGRGGEKLLFELHSHSKFSDGFFSPSKVIERAHINGVSFNLGLTFQIFFFNPLKLCFLFCVNLLECDWELSFGIDFQDS